VEGSGGGLLQAASAPRIAAAVQRNRRAIGAFEGSRLVMWVILLEALGALVLLVAIVWWTMFAGRKRGERRDDDAPR
jgi:F0F1-type ATP synthase membrane subunit c/vacuolar-type H+-ATPase subunit K